jgi:biopolymer transport protein ExbD
MKFVRRRRIESAIDMTPMIDTLLQLFVVFLLSMTFVTSAVRLELPRAAAQPSTPPAPVTVAIDEGGSLFVDERAVTKDELSARVKAALGADLKRQVVLRAHRTLVYDRILETLVGIQQSGAENIQLAYQSAE